MVKGVLVETGFLIALNPRDKNHEWALQLLKQAPYTRKFLKT